MYLILPGGQEQNTIFLGRLHHVLIVMPPDPDFPGVRFEALIYPDRSK
jgi:hypothetical protein